MKFGDPPDDPTDALLRGDVVQPMIESDPTAGLPDDLARVLRDQSIIVPNDQGVFEMIAEASHAPSTTMSAWTVDQWREAWVEARKESIRWQRNYRLLSEAMLGVQGRIKDLFAEAIGGVNEMDYALSRNVEDNKKAAPEGTASS